MPNHWTHLFVAAVPFLLLLALWFFLLAQMRNGRFGYQKAVIEPLRKVLQEDIVPEIRAIRESIDALRADVRARNEKQGQ